MQVYPLKMIPIYKQYIWGGDNLHALYGKNTPVGGAAESWEISCNENESSAVANGCYQGMSLYTLSAQTRGSLYNTSGKNGESFPLLFKLLDAQNDLSVQVHPDDFYQCGVTGKTEMWYILHADKGAQIVYGFKEPVARAELANAIFSGTITTLLNYVDVHAGDAFLIPAGTLHAAGKGMVIAELQQNSNATYRVFDYNRRDKSGTMRELHIEQALDVTIRESSRGREKCGAHISCEFFEFNEETISSTRCFETKHAMFFLFFAEGFGSVSCGGISENFKKGDSFVIPAAAPCFEISGCCRVLVMKQT
ncbi:MAG: mannose-6-phosphate isomerase [Clostridia bacterium]|nr:mannose-6-phosphate isomerase [Clostridia bacterium]